MNLSNPNVVERLAAEYVTGTLRGQARARFERLLAGDAVAQRAVMGWEERLAPLALRVPAVEPHPDTWRQIARRTGLLPVLHASRQRWRAPAMALAAALALFAVGLALWVREPGPAFTTAAVVATTDGRPLWRIGLAPDRAQVRIDVTGLIDTPAGRDFELWALPEGGAPVSLGLLPASGHLERALGERQRAALAIARKVAVSVEPRGGSTTGAPTGPVVHVAPITLAATATAANPTAG